MTPRTGRARPETVTAAAAVVTAVVALGVGVWDNIQTREHNRLSVVPYLVFTVELQGVDGDEPGDAEAPAGGDEDAEGPVRRGRLTLRNEGVGPAVIDSIRVEVDRTGGGTASFSSLNDAEPALATLDEGVRIDATTHVSPGVVLAAGRELPLMSFHLEGGAGEAAQALDFLERFRMVVRYRSVYGEARTDTLDTFRRERAAG